MKVGYNKAQYNNCFCSFLAKVAAVQLVLMPNYQRYSHHAKRVISHAQRLAHKYDHSRVDTGHLLVGILLTKGSLGSQVMEELDIEAERAEVYLKWLMKIDSKRSREYVNGTSERNPYDEALTSAEDEANWLGDHYIGTLHLLLGITRSNVGNVRALLRFVDLTPEQIRRHARQALSDSENEFSLEVARQNTRLSELSRRVLNAAEQNAVKRDHPTIGLGHLLLALHQERRSVTSKILQQSDFDVSLLENALYYHHRHYLISVEELLREVEDDAEKFGHHYVGANHLLYRLGQLPQGAMILEQCGVSVDKLRRLILKELEQK